MASGTPSLPRHLPPLEGWPPDDTEESVVGTDLHQRTIINLRWGINEIAGTLRTPGQPAPTGILTRPVDSGQCPPFR